MWMGVIPDELSGRSHGAASSDEGMRNGVEVGRIDQTLKRVLAAVEKGTVLKFDSKEINGSQSLWENMIGWTEICDRPKSTKLEAGKEESYFLPSIRLQ